MVPGQVIKADTIEFMRKLDVKEIHGYDATLGLKLISPGGAGGTVGEGGDRRRRRSRRAATGRHVALVADHDIDRT